jgi:hypothetical protein
MSPLCLHFGQFPCTELDLCLWSFCTYPSAPYFVCLFVCLLLVVLEFEFMFVLARQALQPLCQPTFLNNLHFIKLVCFLSWLHIFLNLTFGN